jgi:hypothetical protein
VSGLADAYGRPLPADDPLAPLASDVAQGRACCRLLVAMIPTAWAASWCPGRRTTCCRWTGIAGLSTRARRDDERRSRRRAQRARVREMPVRPGRRVDRDRPPSWPAWGQTISAADRAIRVSTAVAVLGVAGIAAYVSYWHAYEVVRAHAEDGVTARLEPATIDGLVYASSMVVLYAARHRPGTGSPSRPWPGGCWPWASWPPWRRTWPTAGPTDQSAPRSQRGPPRVWSAATSFCSGSSRPLRAALWSAARRRATQPASGWHGARTAARSGA